MDAGRGFVRPSLQGQNDECANDWVEWNRRDVWAQIVERIAHMRTGCRIILEIEGISKGERIGPACKV
jgi:hypothetical protein